MAEATRPLFRRVTEADGPAPVDQTETGAGDSPCEAETNPAMRSLAPRILQPETRTSAQPWKKTSAVSQCSLSTPPSVACARLSHTDADSQAKASGLGQFLTLEQRAMATLQSSRLKPSAGPKVHVS